MIGLDSAFCISREQPALVLVIVRRVHGVDLSWSRGEVVIRCICSECKYLELESLLSIVIVMARVNSETQW